MYMHIALGLAAGPVSAAEMLQTTHQWKAQLAGAELPVCQGRPAGLEMHKGLLHEQSSQKA
jgi:hypothetical protein